MSDHELRKPADPRARPHPCPPGRATCSLDRLADVAALSRFHFHRVFRAMTGETVAATVRRIRMDRAGVTLCYSDTPDRRDRAALWATPTSTSFTRAFTDTLGQPPGAYRKVGQYRPHARAR